MDTVTTGRLFLTKHTDPGPDTPYPQGRREYLCTFLVPGHVMAADGSESSWLIPLAVAEEAAPLFEGVACYLDHPEMFGFGMRGEPQVKNMVGVTTSAKWDGDRITGTLRLYDQDPNSPGAFVRHLLDAMLADKEAGIPVPPVGLSAVFYHEAELDADTGEKVTRKFKKVESVDLVYSPGAGGYIKQALSSLRASSIDALPDGDTATSGAAAGGGYVRQALSSMRASRSSPPQEAASATSAGGAGTRSHPPHAEDRPKGCPLPSDSAGVAAMPSNSSHPRGAEDRPKDCLLPSNSARPARTGSAAVGGVARRTNPMSEAQAPYETDTPPVDAQETPIERARNQDQSSPQSDTQDPDTLSHQIAALNTAMRTMQDKLDCLTADLEAEPVPTPEQTAVTVEDLHAQVQHLTQVLADEQQPIQGMGQAHAERPPVKDRALLPGRLAVLSPLDEIQQAWNWIFGVDGATLPPPELRRSDYLYRLLSGDLNWTGVFDQREALAAASTTTLADMALEAMNKVIVPLYDRLHTYRWFEQIVTVNPTDGTLHDMDWIQFGGIGDLPVVAEGAAYTELTVTDTGETAAFTKYGGYVGITDKMIRNSDIAKIRAVPRALTVAALQTRSAKIAAIFTDNSGQGPVLSQDSKELFKSDNSHSNYATTALSWTAWKAARIECAKHAEIGSAKRTGFFPRVCLVPVDLYDAALQIFGYGQGPGGQPGTANNDVNPYALNRPGDPRPVVICVPDWTDATDWAYLVEPAIAPVLQMAYADNPSGSGHPPPQLFSVTSPTAGLMFTNDVLPIKVRDYFAYGVATYRGIGKRVVA